jgi:hypothetical protein
VQPTTGAHAFLVLTGGCSCGPRSSLGSVRSSARASLGSVRWFGSLRVEKPHGAPAWKVGGANDVLRKQQAFQSSATYNDLISCQYVPAGCHGPAASVPNHPRGGVQIPRMRRNGGLSLEMATLPHLTSMF